MNKVSQITLLVLAVIAISALTYFNQGNGEEDITMSPAAAAGGSSTEDKAGKENYSERGAKVEAKSPIEDSAPSSMPSAPAAKPSAPVVINESNYSDVYSIASSYEDAIWLRRHAYPSSEQLRDYNSLSLGELEAKAKSGDLVAKVMAGIRLALAFKNPDGILLLQQAAVEGSIYALGSLSSVYGASGNQNDPVFAEAYRRLALSRGDYSYAEMQPSTSMTPQDLARAEAEFLRLAREYAQARIERNLPPFEMEIRPGLEEYLTRMRAYESALPPKP